MGFGWLWILLFDASRFTLSSEGSPSSLMSPMTSGLKEKAPRGMNVAMKMTPQHIEKWILTRCIGSASSCLLCREYFAHLPSDSLQGSYDVAMLDEILVYHCRNKRAND